MWKIYTFVSIHIALDIAASCLLILVVIVRPNLPHRSIFVLLEQKESAPWAHRDDLDTWIGAAITVWFGYVNPLACATLAPGALWATTILSKENSMACVTRLGVFGRANIPVRAFMLSI